METLKHRHKYNVHRLMANSYAINFIFFLLGLYLDFVFNLKILTGNIYQFLGLVLLVLGTLLILWAQTASRNLNKENMTAEDFRRGPYSYTRAPTHLGLFLLMLGFGLIINALFVVITTIVSFSISRFFLLGKGEKILEEKYGAPYVEYKKSLKF